MTKIVTRTGNEAFAEAMRQVEPDVVAAYPITPATQVVELFSQFVADGKVKTEFVPVESEHSAMSACVGASVAGGRVMTSTSSQGLVLMQEILNIASGLRLPIVIAEVNRAISAPINIHGDHSDTMGARDTGWIQIFSENVQEAYDNLICAVKIAEKANLPVMATTDGFILSHCLERLKIEEDAMVKKFVGERKPAYNLFDFENPITVGSLDLQNYFFEHKMAQIEAMKKARDIIKEVGYQFKSKFGRNYGFVESYRLIGAEVAIVVLGSTTGTVKVVVDELRDKGVKAGLLKIRVFRPFPDKEIKEALRDIKAVAVLDKSDALNGIGGPVFEEVRSALYDLERKPKIVNYVYGLGGRDVCCNSIKEVYKHLEEIKNEKSVKKLVYYLGVRE